MLDESDLGKLCVLLDRVEDAVAATIRQHLGVAQIQLIVKARRRAAKLVVLVKLLGRETLPQLKDFFLRREVVFLAKLIINLLQVLLNYATNK